MFTPNKAKPSRLKVFFMILKANLFGIPTPYGFSLKPRAFQVVAQMSQELESLRVKYDYALKLNERQDGQIKAYHESAKVYHADLRALSAALKEVSNTPNVLSKETLCILEGYKVRQ